MHTIYRDSALLLFALWLWAPLLHAAEKPEQLGSDLVNPGYVEKPVWFKESFLDIAEDVAEAEENGRQLMLYFYQDGCPYCALFVEDLHNRDLATRIQNGFDVVAINMWGDREVLNLQGDEQSEKQFSESLKVMFTPTVLFLNQQGIPNFRMNGYYPPHQVGAVVDYLSTPSLQQQSFQEYYLSQNPTPPSPALHLEPGWHSAPLDFRTLADTNRPLLILFEQKRCASCDELHQDIFRREEVRTLLEQFTVVVLDSWGKEKVTLHSGEKITERALARRLGIHYSPTLIFQQPDGEELFRTEAYLKTFHTRAAMRYVLEEQYRDYPSFQRFVQAIADDLHERGIQYNLMD